MKKFLVYIIFVFLCTILIASAEGAVVAEYLFNGNANDTSGFNQNGTLVGGASFGPGKFGQALVLDGTTGYVHVRRRK
jgi:hypothetical protein